MKRPPGVDPSLPGRLSQVSGGRARKIKDRSGLASVRDCWQALEGLCSWVMSEVTRILSAIEGGDPSAAGQLLPLVYEELRQLAADRMANERPGQTLQATALVHEAYVRLVDVDRVQHWNSRGHFFAAAAEAMRRILVEKARKKQRL